MYTSYFMTKPKHQLLTCTSELNPGLTVHNYIYIYICIYICNLYTYNIYIYIIYTCIYIYIIIYMYVYAQCSVCLVYAVRLQAHLQRFSKTSHIL